MINVTKIQLNIGDMDGEDEEFLEYVRARYPSTDVTLEHCGYMRFEIDCDTSKERDRATFAMLRLWDEYRGAVAAAKQNAFAAAKAAAEPEIFDEPVNVGEKRWISQGLFRADALVTVATVQPVVYGRLHTLLCTVIFDHSGYHDEKLYTSDELHREPVPPEVDEISARYPMQGWSPLPNLT